MILYKTIMSLITMVIDLQFSNCVYTLCVYNINTVKYAHNKATVHHSINHSQIHRGPCQPWSKFVNKKQQITKVTIMSHMKFFIKHIRIIHNFRESLPLWNPVFVPCDKYTTFIDCTYNHVIMLSTFIFIYVYNCSHI